MVPFRPETSPYVPQPGVASGENTPILKRCSRGKPTKHEPGAMLPLAKFHKNAHTKDGLMAICKDCDNDARRQSYHDGKRKELFAGGDAQAEEGLIDPKFIIAECVKLYSETTRIEQKIKLLELMAKYSPEMKNAKPQDRTALMASLMESLKKEKATDAIPQVSEQTLS